MPAEDIDICGVPIICNYIPPTQGQGGGANVPCFCFRIVTAVQGKCRGFVTGKNCSVGEHKTAEENCSGCPYTVVFIAGIFLTKCQQFPLFPGGQGAVVQMNA